MAHPNLPKLLVFPSVRPATLADKEAWIKTIVHGYDIDAQFQWRYPRRKEFPEDARKAIGDLFEETLKQTDKHCLVAELPDTDSQDGAVAVAAIAIWEWKSWNNVKDDDAVPTSFSAPSAKRRDMDPARQQQFIKAIVSAERRYFATGYGTEQLELASIVTQPKYHRRGAASALMNWGIEHATERSVPIILTASPLGMQLYDRFDFKLLGPVDCEVEGDNGDKGFVQAMIWFPEGWINPVVSS